MGNAVAKRILLLIEYDGSPIDELSTGEELSVQTITYFWQYDRMCQPIHLNKGRTNESCCRHSLPFPDSARINNKA